MLDIFILMLNGAIISGILAYTGRKYSRREMFLTAGLIVLLTWTLEKFFNK